MKKGDIASMQKEFYILQRLNEKEKGCDNRLFPVVYNYKVEHNCGILLMENIDGRTLNFYKKVSKIQLLQWIRDVTRGLVLLHTLRPSIIWCDCKPSNLMIDSQRKIHLLDFDRALLLEDKEPIQCYGTVGFAAPEQKNGNKVDGRTDIYGLGRTFLQIEIPWYWRKIQNILQKCVEVDPKNRFQTAGELLYELNRLV